jgi:ubiquitin-protein ligase
VRVTLPSGYPFQKPYMQVLTPIHHPLVSPGGRLALHYAKEGGACTLSSNCMTHPQPTNKQTPDPTVMAISSPLASLKLE